MHLILDLCSHLLRLSVDRGDSALGQLLELLVEKRIGSLLLRSLQDQLELIRGLDLFFLTLGVLGVVLADHLIGMLVFRPG